MKKICIVLIALSLMGCSISREAMLGEISYYETLKDVLIARSLQNHPLLEIKAKDATRPMVFDNVESITVYPPPQPQVGPLIPQFNHQEMEVIKAAIPVVGTVAAGVVAGGTGVLMAHEIGKIATGTVYNMMGQGSSVKIQGGTTANATMSGGTLGQIGPTDATSIPTVVEQPAPIVVNQPEPVVIPQPAPVVVQ